MRGKAFINSDPVLYEIYVRSFADSNGDGIGDLKGITARLDYLSTLGVQGIWLTPIFKSPQADFGYDVSDFYDIHEEFGTLADFDEMVAAAHSRGIAVVLDMILNHTSIEHPWFRDHPSWYHWSDQVPNNWVSVFGGSAWQFDEENGRYYYHRYYKEQPSLNWSNPEVRSAMHEVIDFWVERGVDGFRLDSIDGLAIDPELRDEPLASTAGISGRENDNWSDFWRLEHIYTSDLPQVTEEIRMLRERLPDTGFVVEADLPRASLAAYLKTGVSAFSFEFLRAPLDGNSIAAIIAGAGDHGMMAWAMSNHDQPRLVSRWGRHLARAAAVLLLTLPGCIFIYQGDEIGMIDGKGGPVVYDRTGRDAVRQPMQWRPDGGFTDGTPWLPMIDPEQCNVADQLGDPQSMLELYRALIVARMSLEGPVEVIDSSASGLIFRRASTVVVINLGQDELLIPLAGETILATDEIRDGCLPGQSAVMIRESRSGLPAGTAADG
jgi:alpha-glucosidase